MSKYLFGIFNANDQNQLRDLIEEDIYWEKGIWINYDIYPWIRLFNYYLQIFYSDFDSL